MMARPGPVEPKPSAGRGRRRTSCETCRLVKRKCEGGVPCDRCTQTGVECVQVGRDRTRASKRPLPVSGNENGAAGWREAPASPSIAASWRDPPSSYAASDGFDPMGASTYDVGVGGGELSGRMTALGTDFSYPAPLPQLSASTSAFPMGSIEREQGGASLGGGYVIYLDGCKETSRRLSIPAEAEVCRHGHEDGTSTSLEKSHIEVQGHTDTAMARVAVDAVHRPIDRKDHVEVAFEAICGSLTELSLRGKLDVNRVSFVATGLEFAFVVMRSGWCSTPFLRALRHSISIAGPVPRVDAASRAASAAIITDFLLHHFMVPPASRPHSTSSPAPDYLMGRPSHSARRANPLVPLLPHSHPAQHAVQALGESQCVLSPGPSVGLPVGSKQQIDEQGAGPDGMRRQVPQGGPYDSRRPLPGGIAPEVAWINELWEDPQSAACSFSQLEIEHQPVNTVRTNAYMAEEFANEAEFTTMSHQLNTIPPILLARFMTRESAVIFNTLMTHQLSCENGERTCFVEMINRRGQLVDCVATIRWHFGPVHGILSVRFTPLETYTPPSMGLSAPLNPPIASIISSMARDAAHRCAVSSVVATDQPLPMRAAPRPPLTAHSDDQASWPLLAPSAVPSAPLQAWQDLPTACLGGSGEEGGGRPLQGLQSPPPPIASTALTAAPMATGSARASGAVAGEDSSFPLDATALQPSPQSPTAGASGPPSLNDEEMQLLWDAIA